MQNVREPVICEHCGQQYEYDSRRHCWKCDDPACPGCLPDDLDDPLCPECCFGPLPAHIEPMLARQGSMPADLEPWAFEYKWDGIRALCYLQSGKIRLESRNLRDITAIYPDLTKPSEAMRKIDAVFDGEILAFDSNGRPDFRRLQHRMHVSPRKASRLVSETPVSYYIFDLLWFEGQSLIDESYHQRRTLLESLKLSHDRWQVPATHPREGPAMLRVARKWGLEGVMAKRRDSPYRPGTRSRDWLKIKIVQRQEFVVGGWEPRTGNDRQVGALLLGYYDPNSLGLEYAGRVGTGFDARMHEILVPLLVARERKESPFSEDIAERGTRFLDPKLVADVEYRRWPSGGHLQQASFMGLRDDVPARNVVIERGERSR
jgi:bifunctional non-homologous end joining protein LigD